MKPEPEGPRESEWQRCHSLDYLHLVEVGWPAEHVRYYRESERTVYEWRSPWESVSTGDFVQFAQAQAHKKWTAVHRAHQQAAGLQVNTVFAAQLHYAYTRQTPESASAFLAEFVLRVLQQ